MNLLKLGGTMLGAFMKLWIANKTATSLIITKQNTGFSLNVA